MINRAVALLEFVIDCGWAGAVHAPLAGDASNRRYLRLSRANGDTAVLMDAPPDKGEDVRPFVQIANHLRSLELSAPEIISSDATLGFLLLEDLGDDLFARVVVSDLKLEFSLYSCAIDLLSTLHTHPSPAGLSTYGPKVMADLAGLAFDWYLPAAGGRASANLRADFQTAFQKILELHAPQMDVLIQRDYHAENLLWLPDRAGISRVGLLDFQDAMTGHRAYDLVSLLQDARRDVSPDLEQAMLGRYIVMNNLPEESFRAAYHVLGVQRNLRILGVFARLCVRDGKAHYVDLIPRVWGLLMRDLEHPALSEIKSRIIDALPAPDESILNLIKSKCAKAPDQ